MSDRYVADLRKLVERATGRNTIGLSSIASS